MTPINDYLSAPFPAVDTLRLAVAEAHLLCLPGIFDIAAFDAPCLRTVAMYGRALRDWNTPILINLTTLELIYSDNWGRSRQPIPIPTLLTILSRNAGLISLKMKYMIDAIDPLAMPALDQVQLPDLKQFELQDVAATIGNLLSCLVLPSLKDFVIIVRDLYNDIGRGGRNPFFQGLDGCLDYAPWKVPQHAKITVNSRKVHCMIGGEGVGTCRLSYTSSHSSTSETVRAIHDIIPGLPLHSLVSIEVELDRGDNAYLMDEMWKPLGRLPDLERVEFSLTGSGKLRLKQFLDRFYPGAQNRRVRKKERTHEKQSKVQFRIFPSLSILSLRGLDLTPETVTDSLDECEDAFLRLEEFYDWRKKTNHPLEVVFSDCFVTAEEKSSRSGRAHATFDDVRATRTP